MKKCPKCKLEKSLQEFGKSKHRKDGLNIYCLKCARITAKTSYTKNKRKRLDECIRWAKNNPDRIRGVTLKKYWPDLCIDDRLKKYDELLMSQNKVCKMCNEPETVKYFRSGKVISLAVDHCHKTGRVRGLLCYTCNYAVGLVYDDPSLAEKLVKYLKEAS